jgi:hypothetical protein
LPSGERYCRRSGEKRDRGRFRIDFPAPGERFNRNALDVNLSQAARRRVPVQAMNRLTTVHAAT